MNTAEQGSLNFQRARLTETWTSNLDPQFLYSQGLPVIPVPSNKYYSKSRKSRNSHGTTTRRVLLVPFCGRNQAVHQMEQTFWTWEYGLYSISKSIEIWHPGTIGFESDGNTDIILSYIKYLLRRQSAKAV